MQTQCWGYWKITGLLYLYWPICLGCYAMGLPISDSVWNCGRSLVLWVPGTLGSIGNGILGEYFPEREYNLLDPKRTRKWPKFQPCSCVPPPDPTHPPTWREGDHGGRGARALSVLDHLGLLALHDGHAGVCGAQVDTDDGAAHRAVRPAGRSAQVN